MNRLPVILLLVCVAVTGCVIDPGRGYGDRGWGGRDRNESHDDRGQHGDSHGDRGEHSRFGR